MLPEKVDFIAGMTRLVLVEDHQIMREMLFEYLSLEADMMVIGIAANALEAFALIEKEVPDIVVLDIALPDQSGIAVARTLRELYPTLPLIMLSGHGEQSYVEKSMAAGADGYILKGNSDEILAGIRHVLHGESFFFSSAVTPDL